MTKICSKCGEPKPITEFGMDASKRDGLRPDCNVCRAAYRAANKDKIKLYNSAYREANADRIAVIKAAWHASRPEKNKAIGAAWAKANPEKVKASQAAYRLANKEKIKAKNAAYCAANPDKVKAMNAAWRTKNKDKCKASAMAWHKANPGARRIKRQNRRARKLAAGGKLSKGLSERLFQLQRGKCPCCGLPLGKDYHLDHIVPLARGGTNTDDNIQLLRATCNKQKYASHPIDFMQSKGFLI